MKKLKHNFKKGMAFVLSLAMVAGLVLVPIVSLFTKKSKYGAGCNRFRNRTKCDSICHEGPVNDRI